MSENSAVERLCKEDEPIRQIFNAWGARRKIRFILLSFYDHGERFTYYQVKPIDVFSEERNMSRNFKVPERKKVRNRFVILYHLFKIARELERTILVMRRIIGLNKFVWHGTAKDDIHNWE